MQEAGAGVEPAFTAPARVLGRKGLSVVASCALPIVWGKGQLSGCLAVWNTPVSSFVVRLRAYSTRLALSNGNSDRPHAVEVPYSTGLVGPVWAVCVQSTRQVSNLLLPRGAVHRTSGQDVNDNRLTKDDNHLMPR